MTRCTSTWPGSNRWPARGWNSTWRCASASRNPNDAAVRYDGVAVELDINGRTLASGVSDDIGTVPRYGQTVFTIPVTISAFDVARQVFGVMNAEDPNQVEYELRGKLEGGLFGTKRFRDEGTFTLAARARSELN